jgi:hypothetical protein
MLPKEDIEKWMRAPDVSIWKRFVRGMQWQVENTNGRFWTNSAMCADNRGIDNQVAFEAVKFFADAPI